MAAVVAIFAFAFLMFQISSHVRALNSNYNDQTCPQLESIVTSAVKKAMLNDKTVPAALLRMHFHDCFIRGCDASVLLNSKGNNKATLSNIVFDNAYYKLYSPTPKPKHWFPNSHAPKRLLREGFRGVHDQDE